MNSTMYNNLVAVVKTTPNYSSDPPYNPARKFPEFSRMDQEIGGPNPIYDSVRLLFILLGLDKDNANTSRWNPLSEIVLPGNKVFIKPNLVRHYNGINQDPLCVVTHASIIRPIVDYLYLALHGEGEIIIGDAPEIVADFHLVTSTNRLQHTIGYLNNRYSGTNFRVSLSDTRFGKGTEEVYWQLDDKGIQIDLKNQSFFSSLSSKAQSRLTYYKKNNTFDKEAHNKHTNRYAISKEFLSADVIINVPKMKTHIKAGVSVNLKNLVGIVTNKAFVPHYRIGPPKAGGDEKPNHNLLDNISLLLRMKKNAVLRRVLYKLSLLCSDPSVFVRKVQLRYGYRKPYHGSWEGNDTIWRAVLDLNRIMFYCDKQGNITDQVQRTFFSVVDGVIASEKNGPLEGLAKGSGVLLAGFNPLATDLVAARLMGFDYKKIPTLWQAVNEPWLFWKQQKICIRSDNVKWNLDDLLGQYYDNFSDLGFVEPDNWPISLSHKSC